MYKLLKYWKKLLKYWKKKEKIEHLIFEIPCLRKKSKSMIMLVLLYMCSYISVHMYV